MLFDSGELRALIGELIENGARALEHTAGAEVRVSVSGKPGDARWVVLQVVRHADLSARGVEVILDDRDERPGVKFKDSELIGFPLRVGIGEKSLAKGEVELKPRAGALMPVKPDDVLARVLELIGAQLEGTAV